MNLLSKRLIVENQVGGGADSGSVAGLFRKILADGAAQGLQPIGLGARDTLRLEMAYSLYGNEIDADCNPFEAGLGWVIRLDKEEEFIGKKALNELKLNGPKRRIVGLKLQTRGVPRSHYKVLNQGEAVGEVTSGGFSPSLNAGIALAYVDPSLATVGNALDIEIRNRPFPAQIVKMPFVPSSVKK